MSEINVILRTADQTRKAEVTVPSDNTAGDILQAAADNWSLPTDTDYSLSNASSGKALTANMTLAEAGIKDGDILEVQPVLVAG